MSLIHESAKTHVADAKTGLVKGDRVPGGGVITQVVRELGGNAYYVQWDDLSWEEGPYTLEELKSGTLAKRRTRKTAVTYSEVGRALNWGAQGSSAYFPGTGWGTEWGGRYGDDIFALVSYDGRFAIFRDNDDLAGIGGDEIYSGKESDDDAAKKEVARWIAENADVTASRKTSAQAIWFDDDGGYHYCHIETVGLGPTGDYSNVSTATGHAVGGGREVWACEEHKDEAIRYVETGVPYWSSLVNSSRMNQAEEFGRTAKIAGVYGPNSLDKCKYVSCGHELQVHTCTMCTCSALDEVPCDCGHDTNSHRCTLCTCSGAKTSKKADLGADVFQVKRSIHDIIMEARPDAEVVDNPATGGSGYLIDGEIYTPGEADEKFAGGQWKQTGGWLSKRKTSRKERVIQDRLQGDKWQAQYFDETAQVWFDIGDAQDTEEAARERLTSESARNPVGQKVEIKTGPDAGLTGLVSRRGQNGWFVEIEGIEAGPYKVSSLKLHPVAKKQANFSNQEVFVEVDGEMIKGYVFEDDGGDMVEVSDPDDGGMGMGAPVMVERERIFTEAPNTAKKATLNTGDIYNALRDDRHNGYGYAVSGVLPASVAAEADDLIIQVANELGMDFEDLFMFLNSKPARWLREELVDKVPVNKSETEAIVRKYLNQQEINSLRSEIFAEFDQSMAEFDAFAKRKRAANYSGTICRQCEVGKLKATQVPYGYTCDYCWSTYDWDGNYTGRVGS